MIITFFFLYIFVKQKTIKYDLLKSGYFRAGTVWSIYPELLPQLRYHLHIWTYVEVDQQSDSLTDATKGFDTSIEDQVPR